MTLASDSIREHKKKRGKFSIVSKMPVKNKRQLSLAYTPGVGAVSAAIAKNPKLADELTNRRNMVAVVSDGSAVLGLGNVGPQAAMAVMEGKAILFKEFADIDAVPIVLGTQDTNEIVAAIKAIAPTFGGINLEDISAPRCFEIEERLKKELSIPVFHDDQHGTAIVVLAALTNALKVVKKNLNQAKIVINGAGAAGTAIAKFLNLAGAGNIIVVDTKGAIYLGRKDLNADKSRLAELTNHKKIQGQLSDVLKDADVFIGVSRPGVLSKEMVRTMAKKSIIFAMANPIPEIMPDEALSAGAAIVATGRSDFPNQINNVLVFPGLFRGLLDHRINKVSDKMKLNAAKKLAGIIKNPSKDRIIPNVFDKRIVKTLSTAVDIHSKKL